MFRDTWPGAGCNFFIHCVTIQDKDKYQGFPYDNTVLHLVGRLLFVRFW